MAFDACRDRCQRLEGEFGCWIEEKPPLPSVVKSFTLPALCIGWFVLDGVYLMPLLASSRHPDALAGPSRVKTWVRDHIGSKHFGMSALSATRPAHGLGL
jgi:hypothetical protein